MTVHQPLALTLICALGLAGSLSSQATETKPAPALRTDTVNPDGTHSDHRHGEAGPQVPRPGQQPSTPFEEGGENAWFPKTRKHLGTYYEEEEAVGAFPFKNPNKEPKKFTSLQGSCQCAKSIFYIGDRVYTLSNEPANNSIHRVYKKDGKEEKERVMFITINPEEEGKIEVHMKMGGHQGDKDASVDIQTDDEKLPTMRLQFRATGALYFVVDPPDINLNELTWKDSREFTFQVSSPLKPDFNLTALETFPPKCEVKYEKTVRDGKNVWRVQGKYGPNLEERDGGGAITFKTDANNKPVTMRFAALVRGPLKMDPTGFASFGPVKQGTEGKLAIHLWPTDEFDLQVTKVEFQGLTVDPKYLLVKTNAKVQFKDPLTREDKKNVAEVELAIAKDTPKSTIRGVVKIHTNHPQVPERELQFNGFVR